MAVSFIGGGNRRTRRILDFNILCYDIYINCAHPLPLSHTFQTSQILLSLIIHENDTNKYGQEYIGISVI
jgi:hypothetical protein